MPLRLAAIEPGLVAERPDYRITCFPVRHHATASLGYRFDAVPRRHFAPTGWRRSGAVRTLPADRRPANRSAWPDGRRIEPAMVQGPPTAGASLAVVGDTQEVAIRWYRRCAASTRW